MIDCGGWATIQRGGALTGNENLGLTHLGQLASRDRKSLKRVHAFPKCVHQINLSVVLHLRTFDS
jgi:hypothetical protein